MKKFLILFSFLICLFIFSSCKYNLKNNKYINDINNQSEISLNENKKSYWTKTIKKSDILDFAYKNEISLTNISNIEPIYKDEKISLLKIGNKYFDFSVIAEEFQLESCEIESIEINKNDIVIHGINN